MQSDTENPTGRLAAFLMGDRSPLGRVIRVALKHLDVSRGENQDAVQVAARREMVRLEQGLFILEILIGITPLLGLLGAVSGLVKVFGAFGDAAGQSDPHVIASGIAEALTTTVVGLAIAIPCLIAYSCFVRKIETIALLLRGALEAESKVGLKMNLPKKVLDAVVSALPALRNPTISPLSSPDWVALETIIDEVLAANNLQKSDIKWLVPHQANIRIIQAVAKKLDMSLDNVIVTVQEHGNTSAASVPLALDTGIRDGRIKPGDLVLLEAFGGGFTWGASLVRM
jgi:ATP phosphoribosyltransferase-like protein